MGRALYDEGFDVVELAEVVVSSNSTRDPVQFSKQWPELFKSGRVQPNLTYILNFLYLKNIR